MNKGVSLSQSPGNKMVGTSSFSPVPSLKGALGLLRHVSLSVSGMVSSPKDHHGHGTKEPIYLMVPGFTGNNATMGILGRHISERANVLYGPEFPRFNTGSTTDAAHMLADWIQKIQSTDGSRVIRMVGFSRGGLLAIEALRLRPSLKVDQVHTLGTPFSGTPLAHPLSSILRTCSDINKEGGFIDSCDLSGQIRRVIVHVSHQDTIVPPRSQVPGSGIRLPKVTLAHHPDHTHTCFVVGEKVGKTAERILSYK